MGGIFDTLFLQLSVVIVAASALALITYKIKQPLIIAYIVTGLIIGPGVLGLTGHADAEILHVFSEIGIAFLLFLVGIHLNWRAIKDVGAVSLLAGGGQALITSLAGYGIALLLGFETGVAIFIGVAFALSSTIVVVKLLGDSEDLDRLYGRISVGILIVQDILAMIILLILGAMRDNVSVAELFTVSLFKAGVVLLALWLIARYVLPRVFKYAAQSQELLFLSAIGWCFVVTTALYFLGFGIEIGALLGGISLAGTGFAREIESKIRPLRDFSLIVFFIVLGMNLTFGSLETAWFPSLIFSIFILIGNPVLVILLLRILGYHPRTGFLAGTSLAQISEFSFIMIAVGISAGVVDDSILPMATIVGLVTIAVSSYLIIYNDPLYHKLEWMFEWMAPRDPKREKRMAKPMDILLFGYRDMGVAVLPALQSMKKDYMVVDFDPYKIDALSQANVPAMYGDVANEDMLHHIHASKSKLIVSTIPEFEVNVDLLRWLKRRRSSSAVVLTAKKLEEAQELYKLGASFVIVPNLMGGEHLAELMKKKKLTKKSWVALGKKWIQD